MATGSRDPQTIVDEDEDLADAMGAVLAASDEKGAIEYDDVKDEVDSGVWGQLIADNVLVSVGDQGWALDDPEGVREALDEDDLPPELREDDAEEAADESGTDADAAAADADADSDDADAEEPEGSSWTKYDKMAALAVVPMFIGYSQKPVRSAIAGGLDVFLGPLGDALPFYVVLIALAIFTGLSGSLIQAKLMNTEKLAYYQEQMQELQERRKEAKESGDDEALQEIQEEQMDAMGDQLGMFKEQFRPMSWTMLVNIPLFLWIYWMVLDVGVGSGTVIVMPYFGAVTDWTARVGPTWAWLIWYLVCSFSFGQIVRKALDLDISPSPDSA